MTHRNHRTRGNGQPHGNHQAQDTFVMACPDCNGPLMLTPDDLGVDNTIECSHCGHELQITTQRMPGGGQYWALVGQGNGE